MKIVFLILPFLISIGMIQLSYAVTSESCNCVAFRLDDIQDYWLNDVQTKIIDTFHEKNASLTIGMIGNYVNQDPKLIDDIKSKLGKTPELEIANHGWNHEDFTQFSREQQSILMKNTNEKIRRLFGITPSVFIPPFDTINSDTMAAFLENNFQYVSANTTQDTPSSFMTSGGVYHLPSTAKSGNLNTDNTYWYGENYKQTFAEIMDSLQKYGYAVVVMHPQEYSVRQGLDYSNTVDDNQIHELKLLIDEIRRDGLNIVTINEIPVHTDGQEIPSWVNNIFSWYDKGQISENEVYDAIKFLMINKIINFNSHVVNTVYPIHQNIHATVFWVGEPATQDNELIDNLSSIWDDKWVEHFGGVDDPKSRDGYFPANFIPMENPFYFALPYSDYVDGNKVPDAYKIVYWANEKNWTDSESMLKNKWIMITKGDKTAYAQWEDVGPFLDDDASYVFGNDPPKNNSVNNSGLDLSPAVSDYLGLYSDRHDVVSWQFVDKNKVPDGPWKKIITTSKIFVSPS